MLLRRMTQHVKDQNWFAVALDFLIVVLGVLVATQVSNWNATRADAAAYRDAMQRLAEESGEILQYSSGTSDFIQSQLANVQAAIMVLEACKTGDDAEAVVDRALNTLRSSLAGAAKSDALSLLATDERLLARQSTEDRTLLRQYAQALESTTRTSKRLQDTVEVGEIDKHPSVGFTAIIDPERAANGIDDRRVRLVQPLGEVCSDPTFVKMFYRWERAHVYQLQLEESVRDTVIENTQALGLTMDNP